MTLNQLTLPLMDWKLNSAESTQQIHVFAQSSKAIENHCWLLFKIAKVPGLSPTQRNFILERSPKMMALQ